MKYSITPRETEYNGILFRSRLEAKWACFFDLVGWEWQYEPSEINGYNPDFIIRAKSDNYKTSTIIVEVKPSIYLDLEERKKIIKKYYNVKAHILMLSDMPFFESSMGYITIGYGSQYLECVEHNNEILHDSNYEFEMKCINDFGSSIMIFDGMVYGDVERKNFVCKNEIVFFKIIDMWIKAGNITKFKI